MKNQIGKKQKTKGKQERERTLVSSMTAQRMPVLTIAAIRLSRVS
jgi:hypothetical protein